MASRMLFSISSFIIFAAVILMQFQHNSALPVDTEILRIEQDGDLADVEVNPDDDGMEETIKELYSQLEKLDVKALYERRVILEKLVNNTDEEIAKTQPKYVVTRQDKIFFFTDGAPNARPEGLKPRIGKELHDGQEESIASDDREAEQLSSLLQIAKKHTNNPPKGWGAKKSLASEKSAVAADTPHLLIVPQSKDAGPRDNRDLGEMIQSLQAYVNKLKENNRFRG